MLLSQQRITPKIRDLFGKSRLDRAYFPNRNLTGVGSGREALRQILLNIKTKRIGVPAYTCCVVPEAVRRADKEIVFYDSSIIADIKDIKKIIKEVDALILSYNFGFLPEIDKIATLCKKHNVILIEDCAQALGATYKNKLAGSFGDYAFYSFGISKNIGFCGGLIATDKKIELKQLQKFPKIKLLKTIFEVLVSPVFFNKYLYSFTKRFLSKELNKKQEPLDYRLPKLAKNVISNQLKRYHKILEIRRNNAEYCLSKFKNLESVKPIENSDPSWLYFVILSENKERTELLEKGIEFGEMKTFQCFNQNCKKALEAEQKVLTFALYRNQKEIKFIINQIKAVK